MSELYLKDKKVLTLKDINGVPGDIQKVDNPELLPLCLKRNCTIEKFNEWLRRRSIPDNREGLRDLKEEFGSSWLENKNYASLSDQYWICKRGETWKKINFFTNKYSEDVGNMMFMPWTASKRCNNFSPDLTTNGILKKRWKQYDDRKSYLVKAGSLLAHQEPLSEVLVSVLAENLGIIPCVKYDLCVEGTTICSRCDNFITADTELVPASFIYFLKDKEEGESVYSHLIKMCEEYDIPGAQDFIDGMLFIDSLTGNEDRNLGNIAFIRDVNTMKFIGPAPLYDSGNAYWSTKSVNDPVKSKLFGDVENEVFKKIKKKCDLEAMTKSFGYKKLVYTYPMISDVKKEKLVEAIGQRNSRLAKSHILDEFER